MVRITNFISRFCFIQFGPGSHLTHSPLCIFYLSNFLYSNGSAKKYFKYDSFETLDYQEILDFILQEKEKNDGWHFAKNRYAGRAFFDLNFEKLFDHWSSYKKIKLFSGIIFSIGGWKVDPIESVATFKRVATFSYHENLHHLASSLCEIAWKSSSFILLGPDQEVFRDILIKTRNKLDTEDC